MKRAFTRYLHDLRTLCEDVGIFARYSTIQGDHSGSSQPPVDIKIKVAFQQALFTKTQLLFSCQQEVRNYLNGHPIHNYGYCRIATWSSCYLLQYLLHHANFGSLALGEKLCQTCQTTVEACRRRGIKGISIPGILVGAALTPLCAINPYCHLEKFCEHNISRYLIPS